MYLNIGQSVTVKKSDVVGIFDIDEASSARSLKVFLAQKEKAGKIFSVADALPKSFILMTNGDVWFSPYSAKVLRRRADKKYLEVMLPKSDIFECRYITSEKNSKVLFNTNSAVS